MRFPKDTHEPSALARPAVHGNERRGSSGAQFPGALSSSSSSSAKNNSKKRKNAAVQHRETRTGGFQCDNLPTLLGVRVRVRVSSGRLARGRRCVSQAARLVSKVESHLPGSSREGRMRLLRRNNNNSNQRWVGLSLGLLCVTMWFCVCVCVQRMRV